MQELYGSPDPHRHEYEGSLGPVTGKEDEHKSITIVRALTIGLK